MWEAPTRTSKEDELTSKVEFAAGYEHDTERPNLILLPRDVEWRRQLYPEGVMEHPAKMQMHIVKCVMEYFIAKGEIPASGAQVLDPFGGTGTTALAALYGGAYVTLVELEKVFMPLLIDLRKKWRESDDLAQREAAERLTLLFGDVRQILHDLPENSFDIVITSPPYANLQVGKVKTEFTGSLAAHKAQLSKYGSSEASAQNFGRLNTFMFNQHMKSAYKDIIRVVKPNGLYVSVTKDSMRSGVRNHLNADVIRTVQEVGMVFTGEWWKWKPPGGMMQSMMKSKGADVVEDEDIICFKVVK